MRNIIDAYLMVKDALVDDDLDATDKSIDMIIEKVSLVDNSNIEGVGLKTWQNHQSLYLEKLREMRHISGIENKRSYFAHISETIYCTIKSFGLSGDNNLFFAYCPMALNNKGAYWLTNNKEIKNPYLGKKMLKCGEIKEVF